MITTYRTISPVFYIFNYVPFQVLKHPFPFYLPIQKWIKSIIILRNSRATMGMIGIYRLIEKLLNKNNLLYLGERMKWMDSSRVRDLANEFSRAADSVKESETKLKSMINSTGDSWTGKSRQSFDEEMDEAFSLFHRHADNLYKISDELKSAAEKVDRVREEIERQKELERLALIQQRNNLI